MLLLLALAAVHADPQDVVVMRRQIAAPARPSAPPAPPPPTYRWDAGEWSQATSPAQCGQTVTRSRPVRCLATGDVPVEDAKCQGDKPVSQDSYVDYAGCAVNYACPTWVQDRQGGGGPHYLIYDAEVDATEDARRVRAQKLCEAQPRNRGIQICTSTVLGIKGQPDRLRIFASMGYAVNQPANAVIDSTTVIKTSSIAMCSPANP